MVPKIGALQESRINWNRNCNWKKLEQINSDSLLFFYKVHSMVMRSLVQYQTESKDVWKTENERNMATNRILINVPVRTSYTRFHLSKETREMHGFGITLQLCKSCKCLELQQEHILYNTNKTMHILLLSSHNQNWGENRKY